MLAMKEYKKIPEAYLPEFISRQTELIKSRVKLFCFFILGIYFFATAVSFIIFPQDFKIAEIPAWGFLIASGIIVLYLNSRAHTLRFAKFNAYLFCVLLLVVITRVCLLYPDDASSFSPIYLFVLFVVTFTIPWTSLEVVPIAFLHFLAYGFLFWYGHNFLPEDIRPDFSSYTFIEGLLFVSVGFILCLVVRRKETVRDIENFTLLKDVEEKSAQMEKELELATRVHKTLIPQSVSTDRVNVAVMYLPMYYIGGDYTKFHFIDKDKLIFIICDVTGHGVSAALLVNRIHAEFERLAREGYEPGMLLNELNKFVKNDFKGINMYLSAFCCLLDFNEMKMKYTNYAHPSQYLYMVTDSKVRSLKPQGGLLGVPFLEDKVWQSDLSFEKGDRLLLFTDGIVEAKNKGSEPYGSSRLENFILSHSNLRLEAFNQKLLDELSSFKNGKDFSDDVIIVGIQIR